MGAGRKVRLFCRAEAMCSQPGFALLWKCQIENRREPIKRGRLVFLPGVEAHHAHDDRRAVGRGERRAQPLHLDGHAREGHRVLVVRGGPPRDAAGRREEGVTLRAGTNE